MTPEEISTLKREQYNAQVVYLRKKNPDLMILRVKTDFPRPIHKPGQYSTLGMGFWEPRHPGCQPESLSESEEGQLARRAYSLSCSVLDEQGKLLDLDSTDWLEFYIVLLFETLRFGLARRAKAYNDLGFPECGPSILGDHPPIIIGLATQDQMRSRPWTPRLTRHRTLRPKTGLL